MKKPAKHQIPFKEFAVVFRDFYLATGEFIGKEGESFDRWKARLAAFYKTFSGYRLDRFEEGLHEYLKGSSHKDGFPRPGDIIDEINSLPPRAFKDDKPAPVLTEEDIRENERLLAEVHATAVKMSAAYRAGRVESLGPMDGQGE